MKRVWACAAVLAAWAGLAGSAFGQAIPETESNNTFGTANFVPISAFPFGAFSTSGSISPGDVDYYVVELEAGEYYTAMIFDRTARALNGANDNGNETNDNDTLLGIYRPDGTQADRDDDAGPGFLSAIHFYAPSSGRYAFAISGFGDNSFNGSTHTQNYSYLFTSSHGVPNPLGEVEGNNSYATATFVPPSAYPTGGAAIDGALLGGDVDFISCFFNAGDYVTAGVFDRTSGSLDGTDNDGNETSLDNDSLLGVFGPGGTLLDFDDDAGPGFLSAIHFYVPVSGVYAFAVTGFGDGDFDGLGHTESFNYRLVVGMDPIPAPGVLAPLAGLLLAARRRRR